MGMTGRRRNEMFHSVRMFWQRVAADAVKDTFKKVALSPTWGKRKESKQKKLRGPLSELNQTNKPKNKQKPSVLSQ